MGILDGVNSSADIKKLSVKQLTELSEEIREEIISATKKNGGHLSSNLGIVETTVALYSNFDFPRDKIIFDVGHQCYAHKILSGRKDAFQAIRTRGGISGFPDSEESEYDPFITGHAGNSIALGLGLCTARDALKEDYYVVTVVGDGALVNGLNLEALSATTDKPKKFIVVLNDNGMSISHNGNGFYKLISKSTSRRGYVRGKSAVKKIFGRSFVTAIFRNTRDFFKRVFNKREYFERYGFKYVGVVDGNDVKEMNSILSRIKMVSDSKAVLLHVRTTKGKGLRKAEERSDVYHGVGKNHECAQNSGNSLGKMLAELIKTDDKIVAITAGMKDGTGLSYLEKAYPEKFFDVGIAEEFAVTYAAGMAKGGLKPVVAIYSTFMQRAYDEILHDVCLQNLPVVFCVDRAGFVGEDGKTHQGLFDLSFTTHIPNATVYAPNTAAELKACLTAAIAKGTPAFIRYGKETAAESYGADGEGIDAADIKWRMVVDGEDLTVIAVGARALKAATEFAASYSKSVKVISATTVKPLDKDLLLSVNTPVITVEENSVIGGFGALVSEFYSERSPRIVKAIGVQDRFVAHGDVAEQLKENGISIGGIKKIADEIFKIK